MNLIDAIKSGRPFKRPNMRANTYVHHLSNGSYFSLAFNYEDWIATDWEVEEKKVTITEPQFNKAYEDARLTNYMGLLGFKEALKKELGL